MAKENDRPSKEYLRIGLWAPKENRTHVDFWLTYLLNDILFWIDEEGEIDYRIAEVCENTEGYKKWRLKIKKNLHWSDGSLGTSAMNVVNMKGYSSLDAREAVDVILTQLYFGYGYSRLKRFFHSKGENNILGFNFKEIDFRD